MDRPWLRRAGAAPPQRSLQAGRRGAFGGQQTHGRPATASRKIIRANQITPVDEYRPGFASAINAD
jgi:hypothetical protein